MADEELSFQDAFGEISFEEAFGDGPAVKSTPSQKVKLNTAKRFAADLLKRQRIAEEIFRATAEGEQTWGEGMLQLVGKVGAGGVLDLIGEMLITGGRGLATITPEAIKNPIVNAASSAAHYFLSTDAGMKGLEAARAGVEKWGDFKKNHPRAARNIESVVDIGMLVAPMKSRPRTGQTSVGRAGEGMVERATRQSMSDRRNFIDDLVMPRRTMKVAEGQTARATEQGILRSRQIGLSQVERNMAREVHRVRGVIPGNTLQGNLNVISKEVTREATRLKNQLRSNDFSVPMDNYITLLDDVSNNLSKNMVLRGDPQKTAQGVVETMRELLGSTNRVTGSRLLQARKDLDAMALKNVGKKALDPTSPTENAMSIALREVRQATNGFIDSNAQNVAVRNSLRKQHNLLSAAENIAPKAAREGANALSRAWGNIQRILPIRGEFNQTMATIFGVGGLGAAAMFAPFFTKIVMGTVGVYTAGRIIMSAKTKRGVSQLLGKVDQAIRKTKDAQLLTQLRADRAIIHEMLAGTE